MHFAITISGAILFIILTPGLLLRIPPKGSLLTASIVHAIVFGVLFYFIGMFIYSHYDKIESFQNKMTNTQKKEMYFEIMLIKNQLQAVITYLQNKNIANIPGDPLKNALDNITQAQKYLQ